MARPSDGGQPKTRFARFVRVARTRLGITQGDLARLTGWSGSTIQSIEQGKSEPSLELLAALFDALRIPDTYRARILNSLRPGLLNTLANVLPNTLFADDRTDLEAFPYPVLYVDMPEGAIVGSNQPLRDMIPGLTPGSNLIEYVFTDEGRRTFVNWEGYAHALVFGLNALGPAIVPQEKIDRIVLACHHHPEWARMWNEIPAYVDGIGRMVLRDPQGQVHTFMTRIDSPEWPPRSWLVYRLVPADGQAQAA